MDDDYLFLRRRDFDDDDNDSSLCSSSSATIATSESSGLCTGEGQDADCPRLAATSPLKVSQYTQELNQAARHGDLEEAEALWTDLIHSGVRPDVHALNALL
eukprot:scaffold155462_cov34-Prasinocladus_malaysianus.AAC.1